MFDADNKINNDPSWLRFFAADAPKIMSEQPLFVLKCSSTSFRSSFGDPSLRPFTLFLMFLE
jgi:hypothetical protein